MTELLTDPILQSSVLPFSVTLILLLLLKRWTTAWTAAAVVVGFYVAAASVTGIQIIPLTSSRKIILLGVAAFIVGSFVDGQKYYNRTVTIALALLAMMAGLWVLWPVLSRSEGVPLVRLILLACVYPLWCMVLLHGLRDKPVALSSTILVLASGSGIAIVLSASALLGQLMSALAAASGALWLLLVCGIEIKTGAKLSVSAALLMALLGIAAVVYAQLPWASLVWLAMVPALAYIPLSVAKVWQGAVLRLLIALPAVCAAVYTAWHSSGELMY